MQGKYFDIFFTDRTTRQTEARPLLSVWGRDAREAKDKANRAVQADGRSRRYDLAWTTARVR